MKTTRLPDAERRPRRVAVGTFDGVHLGHREVLRGCDTVLTFDPHPRSVIQPSASPKLLTDLRRKAQICESLGIEELVVIPFDEQFSNLTAREFIDQILVDRLGAVHVSVGENFHFGNHADGDAELLCADPRFDARVVRLQEADGEIVSSSHIRGLLLGGAVGYAGELLGDPFVLSGVVVEGDQVGRTLGFPTANIVPDDAYVTPAHGIYACLATAEDVPGIVQIPAATSIGVRPTFVTGRGELIEPYLLDVSPDLYGKRLDLAFLKRLRGEKRFETTDDLVAQMHRDVEATREIVASHKGR